MIGAFCCSVSIDTSPILHQGFSKITFKAGLIMQVSARLKNEESPAFENEDPETKVIQTLLDGMLHKASCNMLHHYFCLYM